MDFKLIFFFFFISFVALSGLKNNLYASKGSCACSSEIITCLVSKQKKLMEVSLSSLALLKKMIQLLKLLQDAYDEHVNYIDQLESSVQSLTEQLTQSTTQLEEQTLRIEEYTSYVEHLLTSLNQEIAVFSQVAELNNRELQTMCLCIDSLCEELVESQEWYLQLQKECCKDVE